MPLTRGARIGIYEIVEPLGAGGMGEVYRAHDPKLGRTVALKVLNVAKVGNPEAVRRFEVEARAASALNHPGIVTIHDTGSSDGQFYIVMELVDGITLRHMLRRGAPPLKRALHIAAQLAAALAQAHDSGVVHRDLKPENVMVTREGHVKIVDFGLAKLTEQEGSIDESGTQSARGALLGTAGYMSPEQVRGETADFRSDQFAFGAILYELVVGQRAFQRATAVETLSMILNEEPAPPPAETPGVPSPIVWTMERCLSKAPAERYASTRDLAREVQTIAEHAGERTSVGQPPFAFSWRSTLVAAFVLAAFLAGAVYFGLVRSGAGTAPQTPRFTQLTFLRGHVANARFAPDGRTVLYAASWGGAPLQIFETRPTGPESRPVGPASASLASVSSKGELALILGCRLDWSNCVGTLARMPQGGGPREILENVASADWAPDGRALAAIQATGGEYQVQFPPSTPLYATTSKLGFLRFSPRGDRLAFVEHRLLSDEEGVLKVIDLRGQVLTVSAPWEEIRDIAWAPDGGEVWVSASQRGRSTDIHAVSSSGASRLILRAPGATYLQDLSNDNRALVASGLARAHMVWTSGSVQHDLSWLDWSTVADLSDDGQTVLFYEWGHAVETRPVVYLRKTGGSDAVRLGDGKALALSPDGRWALALQDAPAPHLVLLPTGPGVSHELPPHGLTDIYWARWFPDGQRLLVVGDGAGGPGSYVQHVESGRLDAIAGKGLLAMLVSPDGRRVLMHDPLEGYLVWPLDGGEPAPLKGLDGRHRPVQWSGDGQNLYVKGAEDDRVRLYRFHLATGTSHLLVELTPRDPAGVVGIGDGRNELAITPDGRTYVFTYWSFLRDLFLIEGLR